MMLPEMAFPEPSVLFQAAPDLPRLLELVGRPLVYTTTTNKPPSRCLSGCLLTPPDSEDMSLRHSKAGSDVVSRTQQAQCLLNRSPPPRSTYEHPALP